MSTSATPEQIVLPDMLTGFHILLVPAEARAAVVLATIEKLPKHLRP